MPTSLLTRPDETIFAESAHVGEVRTFPNIPRGWVQTFDDPADGGNGGFPPVEWVNYLMSRIDSSVQYFLQRGVGEWSATTLYAPGSVVSAGALVYRALVANSNVSPATNPATWAQFADQAIAGVAAPPGMTGLFVGPNIPAGWLKMNGATLSRITYSALFAAIGTAYGAPDSGTFNLPDVRGDFFRAWDDGRGVDPGRTLGSVQGHLMVAHAHGGVTTGVGDHVHGAIAWTDAQGWHGHAVGDPGHQHSLTMSTMWQTGNTTFCYVPTDRYGGGQLRYTEWTSVSGTGIQIAGDGLHAHNVGVSVGGSGAHAHNIATDVQGGFETRPRNTAFMALIKY